MISPKETNLNTRAILNNEIKEYMNLQIKFTVQKNNMVITRKEINAKLKEINRLKTLSLRK